jgi:alanine racemase
MNRVLDPETTRAYGPPEAEAGGSLVVDLSAIVENWRMLARRTTPAQCAAVVKANAYGCGLEPVTKTLAKAGCQTFFVAQLDEGRRVRAAAPEATIYVLNGFVPGTTSVLAESNLRPVIGSLVELAEWDAFIASTNWNGGAALQVDTGMNRLGIDPVESVAIAGRLHKERHGLTLVMSHLACADTPKHAMNERQLSLFREVRLAFRGLPASLANSSGIFLGTGAHYDMVRPGVALYGANPTPGQENLMLPVVELKGRIAQVRKIGKGETVGYGAAWKAKRATRLAVVAVGYGDGYPRVAGTTDAARGVELIVAEKRCPIVGRVSMDLLTADITDLPENTVRRGDLVTLIGEKLSVDQLAAGLGVSSYELLIGLGRRYHRLYRVG